MPRPPKLRQVTIAPAATFFKPAGVPMHALEMVILALEEVEAIRLKDIEDLHQEECAQRMGVSRATFHHVLKSARAKLADAILNGKAIQVEGGVFAFPGGRFRCRRDGSEWTLPPGPLPGVSSVECPTCRGREVHPVPPMAGPFRGGGPGRWGHGWQGPWGQPAALPRWRGRVRGGPPAGPARSERTEPDAGPVRRDTTEASPTTEEDSPQE